MTKQEQLAAMEQLWNSLCRDAQTLGSPSWHGAMLDLRKARMNAPEARFLTLAEPRKRLPCLR